jgi:predicted DsbA family dithiol-disulfide isomerase
MSNSLLAHRLVAKAFEVSGAAAQMKLVHAVFRAYHEDELDIGDCDVLADLAEDVGVMDRDEVRRPADH